MHSADKGKCMSSDRYRMIFPSVPGFESITDLIQFLNLEVLLPQSSIQNREAFGAKRRNNQ